MVGIYLVYLLAALWQLRKKRRAMPSWPLPTENTPLAQTSATSASAPAPATQPAEPWRDALGTPAAVTGRQQRTPRAEAAPAVFTAPPAAATERQTPSAGLADRVASTARTGGATVAGAGAATIAPEFSQLVARSAAESELRQLRQEVATLRQALAQVTDELQQIKEPARPVAPFYQQAMLLAQQGSTAANIAARCGISLGEAELVVALAHSERNRLGAH